MRECTRRGSSSIKSHEPPSVHNSPQNRPTCGTVKYSRPGTFCSHPLWFCPYQHMQLFHLVLSGYLIFQHTRAQPLLFPLPVHCFAVPWCGAVKIFRQFYYPISHVCKKWKEMKFSDGSLLISDITKTSLFCKMKRAILRSLKGWARLIGGALERNDNIVVKFRLKSGVCAESLYL